MTGRPPEAPFLLGHAETPSGRSGCTVVVCPEGATAGVDVRGGSPGTRETDLLHPAARVDVLHAVVLSGGSALGLATADGVARHLLAEGVGLRLGGRLVPLVAAAILFDLPRLPEGELPDAALGAQAAARAEPPPWGKGHEGSVGAGAGASVGKILGLGRAVKGGVGIAEGEAAPGIAVRAVLAVNALGDVIGPAGELLAGPRHPESGRMVRTRSVWRADTPPPRTAASHTTIGVVLVEAALTKAECTLVARMAQAGVARAVDPAYTAYDGDTLFVLARGERRLEPSYVGMLAQDLVARAVRRGVLAATAQDDLPAARELPVDPDAARAAP